MIPPKGAHATPRKNSAIPASIPIVAIFKGRKFDWIRPPRSKTGKATVVNRKRAAPASTYGTTSRKGYVDFADILVIATARTIDSRLAQRRNWYVGYQRFVNMA